MRPALTQERLRSLLIYEPETGLFRWRVRKAARNKIGDVAGYMGREGYVMIHIDYRLYRAHRLAFLYMTGELPPDGFEVDHKDCNPSNNRWSNLRLATSSQNRCNSRVRHNSTSGVKGVFKCRNGKFKAGIALNGKGIHLGTFDTLAEAARARRLAAKKYHGHYARG